MRQVAVHKRRDARLAKPIHEYLPKKDEQEVAAKEDGLKRAGD